MSDPLEKAIQFPPIKAVIFDMDGLLLDTERIFMSAYQMAANELGYDLSEKVYTKMIGHRADSSQAILRASFDADAPVDEIIDSARRYYYTLLEKGGIPLRPGVEAVLDYFSALDIPMAVATSTHRDLALTKLKSVHLLNRFTAVVSGDEVENGKPAPDIYLEAARLVDTLPAQCLVLEDSPTGLRAAHAAGMVPVHIPDLQPSTSLTESIAFAVFPSLIDFLTAYKASNAAAS